MKGLIGLDAGTTGVTAVLFDEQLRPLARAYREFAQGFPEPGFVEHQAEHILTAVDQVLEQLMDQMDELGLSGIHALGVTNQRETVFALETKGGRALAPGIVWQDRRTAQRCSELQDHAERIRQLTGLTLDPYFSATKIEWLLGNVPDLRERAARGEVRFATVDALVIQHLTQGAVLATDPTNASRTMLFDLETGAWSPELCELFGVDVAWLPEVRASLGDFGTWRGIPILSAAGDQQAALFGQSGWKTGSAKCTFGTGCFLLVNSGKSRPAAPRGLLTTLAVGADGAPVFALEGSVFMGGAIVQWLRDQMGLIETAAESEQVASSVKDTGGVFLVPAFCGLGAPYWAPDARAAIVGLTRGVGRAEIVRAGLEAIALQNAELIELLRQGAGLQLNELLVDGGAATNDLLMQMQADLAGIRIVRPTVVDATAKGVAAMAGLQAGVWGLERIPDGLGEPRQSFVPRLSGEQRGTQLKAWRAAVARVLD